MGKKIESHARKTDEGFFQQAWVVGKHGACGGRGRSGLVLFSGLDFFLFLIAGFPIGAALEVF